MKASIFSRPRMFFAVVGIGIVITLLIKLTRPEMVHQDMAAEGAPAGFIELQELTVRPEITGYGEVQPDLALDLRAEVNGRITYLNPNLKEGEILPGGTTVLKIDDKDYRLARAKAEASLAQSRINLSDRRLQKENIESDIKLAREKLTLAHKDLKRSESLFKKGSLSESAFERSRTSVLQLQQEVQKLITQRDSLPYLIELQQAQIEIAEAELEARTRDLARTTITIPLASAARVSSVNVEAEEYVQAGTTLFSIQGLERVKINTQVTMEAFRRLLHQHTDKLQSLEQVLQSDSSIAQTMANTMGLTAKVRIAGQNSVEWPARVARIDSNLDPASRTVGVIVTVDDPYQDIRPGVKPPLMEGMYMEVRLQGAAGQYLLIPTAAVHEKQLYTLSKENRLQRIPAPGISQGDMILVKPEQLETRRIISSDLFPAINGMQLKPYPDQQAQSSINLWLGEH